VVAETMSPLIVIVGETSSGKSSLALELAQQIDGEILCADSWTVYKDFDIGTAKPTVAERSLVAHHLLDIADPEAGFSAVLFQKHAMSAIREVTARGKVPILVGGTGLYIDSVIYEYGFLPAPDPALRAELSGLSLADVLKRAEAMGLDTAAVDARNKRRIIRLIENAGAVPAKQPLRQNTLLLGVGLSREELRKRVEKRVDTMLSMGLETEVQKLAAKYGWDVEPMKGIGYREWQAYFTGTQSLADTRQKIISSTMNLAKRQRTWFKRNKSIHWINNGGEYQSFVDLTTTFLNKH
jgi:tRNA dimethylallyltransferase